MPSDSPSTTRYLDQRNDLHVLGCASCLTVLRLAKELLRLQLRILSRKRKTREDNAMVRKLEGSRYGSWKEADNADQAGVEPRLL